MQNIATRRTLLKIGFATLIMPSAFRAAAAPRPLGVVELFTSQGCTRCPPADALMVELAEREDVVALAYHVDYWDYLGWKDHLATRENTERQNAYSRTFDIAVYTPQAVVNGRQNVVGSDRGELLRLLEAGAGAEDGLTVDVALSSTDTGVAIDIGGAGSAPMAKAHVILVSYLPQQTVKIAGGDNRGKVVDYRNIVTSYQTIGIWRGRPLRHEFPKAETDDHCAVLVQVVHKDGRLGPILGAAQASLDLS
jgi:hypothetical protein